jgi:hypothetical protein
MVHGPNWKVDYSASKQPCFTVSRWFVTVLRDITYHKWTISRGSWIHYTNSESHQELQVTYRAKGNSRTSCPHDYSLPRKMPFRVPQAEGHCSRTYLDILISDCCHGCLMSYHVIFDSPGTDWIKMPLQENPQVKCNVVRSRHSGGRRVGTRRAIHQQGHAASTTVI